MTDSLVVASCMHYYCHIIIQTNSSDKVVSLYEDLRTSDAPPHLVSQFEEVLSSLVADVKNMENETKRMEERMAK